MMIGLISKESALNILKHGKYYYPAKSHYADNPLVNNVFCDYCGKSQLPCSIGYVTHDLCLSCANNLSSVDITFASLPKPETNYVDSTNVQPGILMMQPSVRPIRPTTRMMDRSVRPGTFMMQPSVRPATFMMQPSIRPPREQ